MNKALCINCMGSFCLLENERMVKMKMRFEKKKAMCREYFMWLADHLSETHELVASCNKDFSAYLIPKGTIDQLSYYGKPVDSYRLSDHWNWYSNTRKCSDPNMVQCECDEMPPARLRTEEGKATTPVFGACVAYYGEDQKYHHVYGERFDRERKTWTFIVPALELERMKGEVK